MKILLLFLCLWTFSSAHSELDHWKNSTDFYLDQGMEKRAFRSAFNALHEAEPKDLACCYTRIAYLFFHFHKNLGDAEGFFKKALQEDPYYHDALVGMGDVYFARNLWLAALDWYELARKYHPKDYLVHAAIASVFYELARYGEAMNHYQIALELNPQDLLSLNNMANLFSDLGQIETAREYYEKVLSIQGEFLPALENLAVLELDNREYSKALKTFRKALSIDGDDPGLHTNIASLYFDVRQVERAKFHLRRALELEDHPVAHNNLALMEKFTDEELGAGVEYVKALRRKWNYSNARRHSAFFRRRATSVLESMRKGEDHFRLKDFLGNKKSGARFSGS